MRYRKIFKYYSQDTPKILCENFFLVDIDFPGDYNIFKGVT
jgi:hypothetical protein